MRQIIPRLHLLVVLCSCGTAHAFCFEEAGAMYGIAPRLLWTISKGESNFNPAAVNYNSNGSYDFGLMQINSSWAPTLRMRGIPWEALADPCTNVKVGAWVLAQCIRDYGYTWAAVGCYNSRTPSKRDRYAARIAQLMSREPVVLHQPRQKPRLLEIDNGSYPKELLGVGLKAPSRSPWEAVFDHDPR